LGEYDRQELAWRLIRHIDTRFDLEWEVRCCFRVGEIYREACSCFRSALKASCDFAETDEKKPAIPFQTETDFEINSACENVNDKLLVCF